jgi:biotin operon repressor
MEDGRMQLNVLVRTLGDTHFLKVLGFFLEHPFHAFNISQISRYLDISRDTVKKDLDFFEYLGYIVRTSQRGPYKLKRSDEMVQTLMRCLDEITRTLEAEVEREPLDRPYFLDLSRRAPTSYITSTGGA